MRIEICDNFYYRVDDPTDNLFNKLNTCKENVLRNNNNINYYSGEWVKVEVNKFISHHVKPMETLKDISKKYNVDTERIMKDNSLITNKLFIGQILKIYK